MRFQLMDRFFCSNCKCFYPIEPTRWRCDCGSPLDLEFKPRFFIEKILRRPPTLWRYREALPILRDESILSMGEGFTPLEEMEFSGHRVLLKVDYLFPTGSYKDRGATVLISKVRELGIGKVVEDSSGNAGSAVAAYCAKAGIECEIFVPQSTSSGKLVQIQTYGAALKRVQGSREKTAQAAIEAASRTYYASHSWNPFFLHGTKTFAFEIWEQLGWKSPDVLVLPVGHGTLLLGAYIGFKELKEAGRIKGIPKLVAIQSTACAPLYQAFRKGLEDIQPIEKKETIAEGIAIAKPVRGRQILEAIRETDGEIITVTEKEIGLALKEMGRKGYFIEPTSAATIAGLRRYLKSKGKKDIVISTLTGMGLKATEKMAHF
jgi:threonine synthase